MILHSQWRDPRIKSIPLNKLSMMDDHTDNRIYDRGDLDKVTKNGLWYPLSCIKMTPEWWFNSYQKNCQPEIWELIKDPIINEDGMIWAIKMGCNRYKCAKILGYESIDCIMFNHTDDCVKYAFWFKHRDPLHNPDEIYPDVFLYE